MPVARTFIIILGLRPRFTYVYGSQSAFFYQLYSDFPTFCLRSKKYGARNQFMIVMRCVDRHTVHESFLNYQVYGRVVPEVTNEASLSICTSPHWSSVPKTKRKESFKYTPMIILHVQQNFSDSRIRK